MKNQERENKNKTAAKQETDIQIEILNLEEERSIYDGELEKNLIRQMEEDNLFDGVQKEEQEKKRRRRQRQEKREQKRQEAKRERAFRKLNRQFARITYSFVTLFLVMMGYLVYFHVVRAEDFVNSSYNTRLATLSERVIRGEILDQDGNVLAKTTVAEDGTETREYPYGELFAHVIGYSEQGGSGLEAEESYSLLTSHAFFLERLSNELQGEKNQGDTLVTTLNITLQRAAYQALGSRKGAVVAIEPDTGRIVAMVSSGTFDPNTVTQQWEELSNSADSVLLNRATQGAYAPGSTFKLVTELAYIREYGLDSDYSHQCSGEITYGDTTIHCYNGTAHGQVDLTKSLAYSCNTSFASIGLLLNRSAYQQTIEDLLFNQTLPGPLKNYQKQSSAQVEEISQIELMMTAMGQGETQVSPYHMALITAAIANDGMLMKPYLVSEIQNHTGSLVESFLPEKYKQLMTSEEAAVLQADMEAVVDYGTGTVLSGRSYTVAGKTGTAEYSSDKDKSHSWFVGYSNVDDPELVIAVVIEEADQSGANAISVAKAMWDAYYQ